MKLSEIPNEGAVMSCFVCKQRFIQKMPRAEVISHHETLFNRELSEDHELVVVCEDCHTELIKVYEREKKQL